MLPLWPNLSRAEQRIMIAAAVKYFERHEDRADFLQHCYAIMWEYWRGNGFRLRGADQRLQALAYKLVCLAALQAMGMRRVFHEVELPRIKWQRLTESAETSFDDASIFVMPNNPRTVAQTRRMKFVLPNGMRIDLAYDDLAELSGWNRQALFRSKKRGTPIKLFMMGGKIRGKMADLAEANGCKKSTAENKCERIQLSWDDGAAG